MKKLNELKTRGVVQFPGSMLAVFDVGCDVLVLGFDSPTCCGWFASDSGLVGVWLAELRNVVLAFRFD